MSDELELETAAAYFVGFLAVLSILETLRGSQASAIAAAGSGGGGGLTPPNFSPQAPAPLGPIEQGVQILAPLHVSANGEALIKRFETLSLTKYNDAGHIAIGWGHDIAAGENIPDKISTAQAQTLFDDDVRRVEQILNSTVQVELTQNQFDALADLVFDIGAGHWGTSTLLKDLNAGNYRAASQQFQRWVYAEGSPNANLRQRRQAEANLFSAGPAGA